MYFLVDFENVKSNGLRGADYLDKNSSYDQICNTD